jgi:hypothetical protein
MYPDDTEDVALCKLEYRLESGLELNLETPQTFGEKLNYMKLFDRNPDYPRIVDKYEVREYVSKRIGSKYLNEIFYSSKNAQTIPFSDLPQEYIVKASHGWNMNIIVKNALSEIERNKVIGTVESWLSYDHSQLHAEWAYSLASRRVLIEKYLGDAVVDYKIYCFDGKPMFIKVDADRDSEQTTIYLDTAWEPLPFGNPRVRRPKTLPPRPSSLPDMVYLAAQLSQELRFARVDFFEVDCVPVFGEITLYPSGGNIWFSPSEWNTSVGKFLNVSGI